jgi:hypothetical protein
MIYLCPQRGCSGVHNLTQEDVGRTFTCNKCSSMLRFDGDGLRMLSPPSSPAGRPGRPGPPEPPPPPRADQEENIPVLGSEDAGPAPPPPRAARRTEPQSASRNPPPMSPNVSSPSETRVLDVLFTGVYALGTCVVLLFLFLPLLDKANASKKDTEISVGKIKQDRLELDRLKEEREIREKRIQADKERSSLPPEQRFKQIEKDQTARQQEDENRQKEDRKRREQWQDTEFGLSSDVRQIDANARTSNYFYTWGMLFGFLILAFGSAGFVASGSTASRRILGVLTLLIEVLFVFLIFFAANYNTTQINLERREPVQSIRGRD